jgi:hypothetical protein
MIAPTFGRLWWTLTMLYTNSQKEEEALKLARELLNKTKALYSNNKPFFWQAGFSICS